MRSAHALVLGILLALGVPGLLAQANPASQAPAKPATPPAPAKPAGQSAAPAAKPAAKPGGQGAAKPQVPAAKPAGQAAAPATKPGAAAAKPSAKPPAKSAAKAPAAPKKRGKPAARPAKKTEKPARLAESETRIARRDPFESLIGRQRGAAGAKTNLPPGKAGLQVGTLRLDGVVRAPSGMIAVVTNPQSRTYFLREGDQLYDGRVDKITMDSVSFHEVGKDAFGKPVERQVEKRIYSSAGEQP